MLMKGTAFSDIVFYWLANYQGVGKSLGCGSMYKFMLMKVHTIRLWCWWTIFFC